MAVRVVLGAGAALLAVGVLVVLLGSADRSIGTNWVKPQRVVVPLAAGATACQGPEDVPAGTRALRLAVDLPTGTGPALAVSVGGARGSLAAGWEGGGPSVPLTTAIPRDGQRRICVRNDGPGVLPLVGAFGGGPVSVGARDEEGRIRLTYDGADRGSWLSQAGTIFDRFGRNKAGTIDSWALIVAIVLLLGAAGAATFALLRTTRT